VKLGDAGRTLTGLGGFTDMAPPKTKDAPRGTFHASVFGDLVTVTIRARPLPEKVTAFLTANSTTLRRLQQERRTAKVADVGDEIERATANVTTTVTEADGEASVVKVIGPEQFWTQLDELFREAGREWAPVANRIWAFGPKRVGPNVLVDGLPNSPRSYVFSKVLCLNVFLPWADN
jgi:ribosome assembly protein 1